MGENMDSFFQDYDIGEQNGEAIKGEAYVANIGNEPKPCVLIAHAWAGQGSFDHKIADEIAALGYAAIAIDMFGKGVRGDPKGDNSHLIGPLVSNRIELLSRLKKALDFAKSCDFVDKNKISIIGFCFGGLCALDLARAGVDIKAAISFHGLFMPNGLEAKEIKAKVLVLHGYDDPLANPDAMIALANELTIAKADWQIHAFGNTSHAFTNPHAKKPENGLIYNETSAKRAFAMMEYHLKESFK